MINLSLILESSATRYPSRPAFTGGGLTFTFGTLNEEANRVANGLVKAGIRPGDKVALNCLNNVFFPVAYFGILKAGAVVVPVNILLKKDEIAYQLADSDAKAFFCYTGTPELPMGKYGWDAFNSVPACTLFYMIMPQYGMPADIPGVATLETLIAQEPPVFNTVRTQSDDTAAIIYTSGTTGQPKGAELSHANLWLNASVAAEIQQLTPADVQLIALPMFHIFAMTVQMNASIYYAVSSILVPRFEPELVLRLFLKHEVTIFSGVPSMYWSLLHCKPEDIDDNLLARHLRLCISGGASLPLKVLQEFEARFDMPVLEGYGMSEGSPIVTFNYLDYGRRPGSIGIAARGIEVMIADENGHPSPPGERGELWYRGHNVMKGYYKKPEATAEVMTDGWLHSGDIALKDEEGFYYIVDRIKDVIIRGGKNVYPREVEEEMMKHEAVSLVAVVGVPCEKLGEEVKAFVVLKKNCSTTEEEIIAWTKDRIAAYKYPRHVELVESLPMTASGKILKKDLRSPR
ncbi:MAG TPA: long-chain fatty acid--CoA ligase [Chitinophaga sp.]|uniref:long-chain-fatty-acid--CoA ligase n=1 Tax=Chitinophaga sp. TaxID=1869181 RepID=UPI002CFA79B7|nr:long-chain fatty acid--CoA ligase [Chitinophaga sp.]HVI47193.1 long-chain fatty acid--CoA ligase [Chitinophaga sp.]